MDILHVALILALGAACGGLLRQGRRVRALARQEDQCRRLYRLAYTDALTGLANRAAYRESFDRLTWGEGAEPVYCVILDVDHLKTINDQNGHQAGDLALQRVADALRKVFPEGCHTLFRIGGDEFALQLRGLPPKELEGRFTALRDCLEARCLSVSLGHARLGEPCGESAAAAFELADRRMYENKKA